MLDFSLHEIFLSQAVTRPDTSASVGPAGGLQTQAASHIRKVRTVFPPAARA